VVAELRVVLGGSCLVQHKHSLRLPPSLRSLRYTCCATFLTSYRISFALTPHAKAHYLSFTTQHQHSDRLLQEQDHTVSLLQRSGLYTVAIRITAQRNEDEDEDRIVQSQTRQNQPILCLALRITWTRIQLFFDHQSTSNQRLEEHAGLRRESNWVHPPLWSWTILLPAILPSSLFDTVTPEPVSSI
jgi:hypothetical protein